MVRELDESALIDGAGPLRVFVGVIFPLLRSVAVTVIVVRSVVIFNHDPAAADVLVANRRIVAGLTAGAST